MLDGWEVRLYAVIPFSPFMWISFDNVKLHYGEDILTLQCRVQMEAASNRPKQSLQAPNPMIWWAGPGYIHNSDRRHKIVKHNLNILVDPTFQVIIKSKMCVCARPVNMVSRVC